MEMGKATTFAQVFSTDCLVAKLLRTVLLCSSRQQGRAAVLTR